jgi:hypothetical protein
MLHHTCCIICAVISYDICCCTACNTVHAGTAGRHLQIISEEVEGGYRAACDPHPLDIFLPISTPRIIFVCVCVCVCVGVCVCVCVCVCVWVCVCV